MVKTLDKTGEASCGSGDLGAARAGNEPINTIVSYIT